MIGSRLSNGPVPPTASLEGVVNCLLADAAVRLAERGIPVPSLEGKLLRPSFALAMVPRDRWQDLNDRFWWGALAIQMVHEASLIHDDVIDSAEERRGAPSIASNRGAGWAIILGDHYLTGAYRAAAATGSFAFVERFTEAVERTVAGEIAQAKAVGRPVTLEAYDETITAKSGALFGAASALGSEVAGFGDTLAREAVGQDFGNFYQRIDDLLDYCPEADTGKPPLQDYRQGKWSWILDLARLDRFGDDEAGVLRAIFGPRTSAPSAARRSLEILRDQRRRILRDAVRLGADHEAISSLLGACYHAAEHGVLLQEASARARIGHAVLAGGVGESTPPWASGPGEAGDGVGDAEYGARDAVHGAGDAVHAAGEAVDGAGSLPVVPAGGSFGASDDGDHHGHRESPSFAGESAESVVRSLALALGGPRQWPDYFGDHAKTFRLAARLFPPREAGMVSALYAYCRFTDDLVDDPEDDAAIDQLARRLAVWRELSLAAFDGSRTGIPLLDSTLRTAADLGVDRAYPEALLDGVAMDLGPRRYESWADLERYTFGVAGAVGGWMSQLFGVVDPDMLERAHALGHGMQLTNIARDVGEDWQRGRVYVPDDVLATRGISHADIGAMVGGDIPISPGFRQVVGDLIDRADGYYEVAWPGIRELPTFFRRPVAAAASAYRGIHREIRRNDFDTLTRRAHTSLARKLMLAGAGVVDARRSS